MIREKATKMLEYIKHTGNGENEYKSDAQSIAIDTDIEALQEGLKKDCKDCVNRQAVLDLVNSDWKYEGLEVPINSLPSATPAWKKSRWILIDEESNTWQCLRCKELGKDDLWQLNSGTPKDNKMHYCPYCGAEIESEE